METLIFPDVKAMVIGYLNEHLPVTVASRVPNPRPTSFVRVLLSGGHEENIVIQESRVTVEAWANVESDAQKLAQLARAHLKRAHQMTGIPVYRVNVPPPVDYPDDETGQYRYQFVFTFRTRAQAI